MENDTKTYTSKEIAKRINVEPVTVRKYSQMLEDEGYSFRKDEKGWRQYSDNDIKFLEYLCNMKKMGKSLDESVKHVASLYQENLNISNNDTALYKEENPILEFMKRQEEFNKKLIERMDQRDKNLLAAIRELQEAKKEIASTKKEDKKKWWQFWK